jgi:type II secretory pathway component GspD/PulD (secretin)
MQGIQSILSEGANANQVLGSPGTGASSALHAGGSGFVNDTGNSAAALGGASAAGNALSASLSAGSSNGLAIANPELGLITVTAKPAHLARIAHYVDAINERFAHNVLIDVKIFSVSLDAQHSLGFGLNVLYKPLTA